MSDRLDELAKWLKPRGITGKVIRNQACPEHRILQLSGPHGGITAIDGWHSSHRIEIRWAGENPLMDDVYSYTSVDEAGGVIAKLLIDGVFQDEE